MGQKANPIGNRLGIIKGWDSNWFGGDNYSDKLVEDEKIRKYLSVRIAKGGVSKVVIERTLKRITVTVHTARPGIVIGKGGQEVDKIKEELKKITKKDVQINIFEIKRPELDAQLVESVDEYGGLLWEELKSLDDIDMIKECSWKTVEADDMLMLRVRLDKLNIVG